MEFVSAREIASVNTFNSPGILSAIILNGLLIIMLHNICCSAFPFVVIFAAFLSNFGLLPIPKKLPARDELDFLYLFAGDGAPNPNLFIELSVVG